MLSRWGSVDLGFENAQGANDVRAGFDGVYDVVEVASLGRDVGGCEASAVVGDKLGPRGVFVFGVRYFTALDDVDCALGPHDCDLS